MGYGPGEMAVFGVNTMSGKAFRRLQLAEADEMTRAAERPGKLLAINWPNPLVAMLPLQPNGCSRKARSASAQCPSFTAAIGARSIIGPTGGGMTEQPRRSARVAFYDRARGGGSLLDTRGTGNAARGFKAGQQALGG